MKEKIEVGFQGFADDSAEEFGAVRAVSPDGRGVTVYDEASQDRRWPPRHLRIPGRAARSRRRAEQEEASFVSRRSADGTVTLEWVPGLASPPDPGRRGPDTMTLDEITAYLHAKMPITRSLGARVERCDGDSVRIAAPLAPNLNHFATAFGGSLSAVAILSGWVLLDQQLRGQGIRARVVIQRSAFDFAAPVDGDFTATSILPPPAAWSRFLATLSRHHTARVTLSTTIACASGVRGRHEGTYVAVRT